MNQGGRKSLSAIVGCLSEYSLGLSHLSIKQHAN